MKQKICVLIIDGQEDFCEGGNLPVPGAKADMERLAAMINKHGHLIDGIHLTLDSHYPVHVAHGMCWIDKWGNHPKDYTVITEDDVKSGVWRARNPGFQKRYESYVSALKKGGRYDLRIWPQHCIIGSKGQCLHPTLFEAVNNWEHKEFAIAQRTTKGSNIFTEHFSAVKAEVEDPEDLTTRLNDKLIDSLKEYDIILSGGEALSHCWAFTIGDIATEFGDDQIKKICLLQDASSSVPGCEKLGEDFVNNMVSRGMQLSKTTKFF